MKLMSFFVTVPQVLAGLKDVTRRTGWEGLRKGDVVMAVDKGQGLRRPKAPWRMGEIRIVDATRQRLDLIDDDDVAREGFPGMSVDEFIHMFCRLHKTAAIKPESPITRIVFRPTLLQESDMPPMRSLVRWVERGGERRGHIVGMVPANRSPTAFIDRASKALKAKTWTIDPDETRPSRSSIALGVDGRLAWPREIQMDFDQAADIADTLRATGALKGQR